MTLDTFFKKFDQFADAPDAVAKMRELVLDLAVSGRLISPAKAWLRKPLKTLATRIGSGATPSGGRTSYATEGIPLIRSMNVHFSGFRDLGLVFLSDAQAKQLSNVIVEPDDVLLNITGASIGRVTTAPSVMAGARVNQHVTIIRPIADLLPRFLSMFLASPSVQRMIDDIQVGATRQALTKGMIEKFEIPLPPLAEQKRIVAKVDELMALCDRLEAQQQERDEQASDLARASLARFAEAPTPANLNLLFHKSYSIPPADLRKAILAMAMRGKLVTQDPKEESSASPHPLRAAKVASSKGDRAEPFELPRSWKWMQLGEVSTLINGDRSKNYPNKAEYVPQGVAWINTGHIEPDGTLSTDSMHYITRKKFDSLRSGKVQPSDLVYCLRGATLGKTAIITQFDEGAVASSLVIIRLSQMADPRFVYRFLTAPLGRMQIFQFDNGSAQPNLSANNVKKYWIPIPPLAEQSRIVAKVDQLMALVDQLETQLAASSATAKNLLEAVVTELTSKVTISSANGAFHDSLGQRPRKSPAKATKG